MRTTRGTTYKTLLKLLIVSSVAVLVKTTSILPSILWNKIVKTGSFDFILNMSVEECYILCWRTQQCKSINYLRHFPLCQLNKLDPASDTVNIDVGLGCFHSVKSQWTAGEISAMCTRHSKTQSECTKDGLTGQYCPKPNFVSTTEVIRGNLIGTGKKIRYACIISAAAKKNYSVGVSECQDNGTWSDAWRPCREQGKNYALNKRTNQSTTFDEGYGPSSASYGVDGETADDPSNPVFTCAHGSNTNGWWYVDLDTDVVVGKIVIYTRTDDPGYTWFQGMQFNVSRTRDEMDENAGDECEFFEGPIADLTENPITIECRVPLAGRFVRVTAITGQMVIFCELEVYTRVDWPV